MESTKPLIVPLWTAAKKSEELILAHTIPYRKDGLLAAEQYVTECTRFAAPAPGMVFRGEGKMIGKG